MTAAVIGALRVTLGLNSAQFTTGLTAAQQQLAATSTRFGSISKKMAGIGAGLSLALTAPIVAFGMESSKAAIQAANALAQVEAALQSTGNQAGFTADQLADMAGGLMNSSLFDDDDIMQDVTAGMLRFGAISGDVFARAQQVAVDYAARTGKALDASTTLVGKALNNPLKAAGALAKVGITLSASQEATIKSMMAVGNVAGAQALVLGLLEGKYAGAAEAAQNTDPYNKLKDALGTLQENFGAIVNNYLTPFANALSGLAERFNGLSPAMQNFIVIGAGIAAAIGPILVAVGAVVGAIGTMAAALGAGGALAGIAPFLGPIGIAVLAVAGAFYVFRDDIIPVLKSFGASLQEHVGPKLKPLFDAVIGLVTQLKSAFSAFFSGDNGEGAKALMQFGDIIAQVFGAAVSLITGAINTITQIMRALGALLNGDFSTMWNALGSAVGALVTGVLNAFEALFPGVIGNVRKMVDGIREWFGAKLTGIFDGVINRVKGVSDAFFRMYDAVVGHSYVPDMVDGVGAEFARLQSLMVDPATAATEKTADRFKRMGDEVRSTIASLLTDAERDALELQRIMSTLDWGLANGKITQAERDRYAGRANDEFGPREVLDAPVRIELRDLEVPAWVTAFGEHQKKLAEDMAQTIADSRADFADAFSYGIEAAMNGDWTSVLQTIVEQIFGGTLQDALRNLGGSIFDKMGGSAGGKGFDFGSIFKSVGSFFGGKIPGFATGGSFKVGGSGGADSKLMSMRLTPGEMVDIRRPGQLQAANSNAPMHFDLRGAVMTADLLSQMQGMASQSGGNALRTARVAVPADQAKSNRYSLGGRR